jgi:hypothetical protein
MTTAKELFEVGAEPIDIMAAHLLWKSPWWAKALESMQEITVSEASFLRTLGRLYRDLQRRRVSKITQDEFCDLATMARKVRWKFPNDRPGFGESYLGRLKAKLSNLKWNQSICRFEVKPFDSPKRPDWNSLTRSQKKNQAAKFRKIRKNPVLKAQRAEQKRVQRLRRDIEASNVIAQALKEDVTSCTTSNV